MIQIRFAGYNLSPLSYRDTPNGLYQYSVLNNRLQIFARHVVDFRLPGDYIVPLSSRSVVQQSKERPMLKEFMEFLKQYGVIGLAIAVIIGGKLNALVTATVDGILMPVVTFFVPGGEWRRATCDLGPFHFLFGPF